MILNIGDIIEMKKPHPCGEKSFFILRVGSDIRVRCVGCSHELTFERVKLEKMIKRIKPKDEI